MNVDATEIAKFSDIAGKWWDRNSEFRALHDINPLRVKWIDDKVGLAGKKILDVGCGGGILAESMAALGATVTGIDLSEKSLQTAKWHLLESGLSVDYQYVSAEDHAAAQPATYDVVTCLEMLEHVPNPAAIVAACSRLVKPGGWVLFSTLNRNAKSYAFAILGAEYVLGLIPRGTHDWARFIKPAELARMARTSGLTTDALCGLTYNPTSKSYKLDTDTDVNYLFATRREA